MVLLEAVRVPLEAARVCRGNEFVEAVRFALHALRRVV
jgi:hypothetical protein